MIISIFHHRILIVISFIGILCPRFMYAQERDILKGQTGLLVLLSKDQQPVPELEKLHAYLHDALQKYPSLTVVPDTRIKNILTLDRPDESLKEDIYGWKRSIHQAIFTDSSSDDPNSLSNQDRLSILKKLLSDLEKTNPSVARWKMYELAMGYLGMVQWWMIGFHEPGAPSVSEWMETYTKLLRTQPEVKLSESSSSQELDMIEKARAKIKTIKKGALTVETEPSDAEVLLDGVSFGKTPFRGEFVPGRYHLQVAHPQAGKLSVWVNIGSKEDTLKLNIAFERAVDLITPYPALQATNLESYLPTSWLSVLRSKLGINTVITVSQFNNKEGNKTRVSVVDLSNGHVLRECEITTKGANSFPTTEDIQDLALFVVTGGLRGNVEDVNKRKVMPAASPVSSSTTIKIPDRDLTAPSPATKDKEQSRPWYKAWYVYAITGGIILAGSIAAHVVSRSYASSSPGKDTSAEKQTTANALLGVAIGGYVVSAAVFVTGTIFYFSAGPPETPSAGVGNVGYYPRGQAVGLQVGIRY
jgi:hypothetical protein